MIVDDDAENDAELLGQLVGGGWEQVQEINLSPEEQEMVRKALYEADMQEQ